jgi:hypothetical protein
VARDAREEATADGERKRYLIRLRATERDDRLAAALLALRIDAAVVVPLVHRTRLRLEATSAERVQPLGL